MVALTVLVSLVVGVFLIRVDANSYWAQVFAAVGALIGTVSWVMAMFNKIKKNSCNLYSHLFLYEISQL